MESPCLQAPKCLAFCAEGVNERKTQQNLSAVTRCLEAIDQLRKQPIVNKTGVAGSL